MPLGLLGGLKAGKAPSLDFIFVDFIKVEMLHKAWRVLTGEFIDLFIVCWATCDFPASWKVVEV